MRSRFFNYLMVCCLSFGCLRSLAEGPFACNFNTTTLSFDGSPKEQAMCLLRPVAPKGIVGEPLKSLPPGLQNIGDRVQFPRAALRSYLVRNHISEADLGGDLDAPLSRTETGLTAEYFVIHDTSAPKLAKAPVFPLDINTADLLQNKREFWASNSQGHLYITRIGESVAARSFDVPWRATQFELKSIGTASRGRFLHVENVQPRMRDSSGPPTNDYISPDPGFTDAQLRRLALVYVAASVRKGTWMIPAFHGVLDLKIGDHDDPQHFDLQKWATLVQAAVDEVSTVATQVRGTLTDKVEGLGDRDYAAWADAKANGAGTWTSLAESAVSDSLLPRSNPVDVKEFCGRYAELAEDDRIKFWVTLVSKIAELESDFDPHNRYTEKFKDEDGNPVVSRGLLQLSMGDRQDPEHGCRFGSIEELEEPSTNLRCGVTILSALIAKDGYITTDGGHEKGGARYWSVLRRGEKFDEISTFMRKTALCAVAR